MDTPFLRAPFNYDRDAASTESGLLCEDRSLAQQQFREECDINTIVERFGISGELPSDVRAPQYGDFTEVVDYHTALNVVRASQEAFDALPARVRARFHNDPSEMLEFVDDEGNRPEAERLGLVDKQPPSIDPAEPAGVPSAPPA